MDFYDMTSLASMSFYEGIHQISRLYRPKKLTIDLDKILMS